MSVDHLSDALNSIKVHESVGKSKCEVPVSKLVASVLEIFRKHGYIAEFAEVEKEGHKKVFRVTLDGRVNNCGTIKPRATVKRTDWAKMEQRYIPGIGIGLLIVTTPEGVMTNSDAQEKKIGGRLLAYVY